MFRTKRDAVGQIVWHKARLVAKGYTQLAGVDFNKTFVLVAKFITIRCILAIKAAMDLEIHQMDIKASFLNGMIEVKIYMGQLRALYKRANNILCANFKKHYMGLSNC